MFKVIKNSKHPNNIWKWVGGSRAIFDRKYKIWKLFTELKYLIIIGFQKKIK